MDMYWLLLVLAGLFEAVWASALRLSEGFSKPIPSIITVIFMIISLGLLAYTTKYLPIGTAYVVWTGVGAVATTIVGMFIFNEPTDFLRIMFICLIIAGVIGLHFLEK